MGLSRILVGILLLLCAVCCGAVCNVSVASKGFQDEHEEASNTSLPSKRFLFKDNFKENKEMVEEYLLRDVVREHLLIEWGKYDALRKTTHHSEQVEVDFEKTEALTLKDVFHFLQFFPLLYRDEKRPVVFKIPVTMNTKPILLVLENVSDKSGTFTAFHLYQDLGDPTRWFATDLSDINSIIQKLHSSVSSVISEDDRKQAVLQNLFHSKLVTNFQVNQEGIKSVFMRGVEFLASTSILRKNLPPLSPVWLGIINYNFENERAALENILNGKIKAAETTKLRYELTASMMLLSSDHMKDWQALHEQGIVVVSTDGVSTNIKINQANTITLRELFKLLQSSLGFYSVCLKMQFEVTIGGSLRKFWLSKASRGEQQIIVQTRDADWPDTKKRNSDGQFWAPSYEIIINELKAINDQQLLATIMIAACKATLAAQPDFEYLLRFFGKTERANKIRHIVEFLVITMVAEAAVPTDAAKKTFVEQVADEITENGHFPGTMDMPHLGDCPIKKAGRSPTMDDVVFTKLEKMRDNGVRIEVAFNVGNFPIRKEIGGTAEGRKYLYKHGNDEIPSYFIRRYADTITQVARRSCTGSK